MSINFLTLFGLVLAFATPFLLWGASREAKGRRAELRRLRERRERRQRERIAQQGQLRVQRATEEAQSAALATERQTLETAKALYEAGLVQVYSYGGTYERFKRLHELVIQLSDEDIDLPKNTVSDWRDPEPASSEVRQAIKRAVSLSRSPRHETPKA